MRSDCDRPPGVGGAAAIAALLAFTAPCDAVAAGGVDASYGRVRGDVTLVAGVGMVATDRGPRGEGEVRVRYLETAGLFASYEDGPLLGSAAEPRRVFATGLELRPLFLFRWLDDRETSEARLDLLIDSIGIELGAAFMQPSGGSFSSRPGAQVGVMLEFPVLAGATGPWLGVHAGVRWSDEALAGGSSGGPDDRSFYLSITAAWHQVVLTHTVDMGDTAPR